MIRTLLARISQKHRTILWPDGPAPALAQRYRGLPAIDTARCPDGCRDCASVCPTEAISFAGGKPQLDLGRCLFCPECEAACPEKAISFTSDYRLSVRARDDLRLEGAVLPLAKALDAKLLSLFGRSLKLRQVSAGGCNACEADVNVLGTIGWDLGRFGIQVVASPRHADGLLITGARHEEHGARAEEDVGRRPAAEDRHRRRRLRDLGRAVLRPPRAARRGRGRRPGRPLHSRLPAPPAHDPRRSPQASRPARGRRPGPATLMRGTS